MTDEQIEKALECCCSLDTTMCEKCPYFEIGRECVSMSTNDAIALIKRQRDEIARLRNQLVDECDMCIGRYNKDADEAVEKSRYDAIREFAERISTHIGLLEEKAEQDCAEMCRFLQNATIELHAKRSAYRDVQKCMSEIVEEMTEEQK